MATFKSFDDQIISYSIHSNPKKIQNSIIIVHGFGGDVLIIQDFINYLIELENTQVISYELRGHANSSKHFSNNFSFIEEMHTLDLQALINHLNIVDPILIGHSLGGIIIQEYLNMGLRPTPKQIFLICSTTEISGISIFRKFLYKLISQLPESKNVFKTGSPQFYRRFKTSWDINLFRYIHDTTVVGGILRWMLYFSSLNGWKNKKIHLLDNNDCFYIYGKKDIIVPAQLQKQRIKKLTRINKIEIDAGHIVPITKPEELATLIKKHIKK
jgi:pimeloyl-ACP methyl ester carboxylesterase